MEADTAPPPQAPEEPDVVATASPILSGLSNTTLLASLATALLGLALFFLLTSKSSRRRRGSTVLLVGPSDAGKTAILSALAYSTALPTHTSLQPNGVTIQLQSSTKKLNSQEASVRVLDVPGHPRLRAKFAEYLDDTRAIVFVVDAGSVARNGAMVAEHLHIVLRALASLPPSRSSHAPALLIHAHKADLLSQTSPASPQTLQVAKERIKTVLERELEKRRKTFAKGVAVEGLGSTEGEDMGGMTGLECSSPDGTFRFDKWEGPSDGEEVGFSAGWVDVVRDDGINSPTEEKVAHLSDGMDGLKELREWLTTLV